MTKKAKQEVDQEVWWAMYKALVAAKENSEELLECHNEESYDTGSKRFRAVQRMYEQEIIDLTPLIQYSENNGGVPF